MANSSSSHIEDELTWAAAWLYNATGEQDYLTRAESTYQPKTPWSFDWDDKTAGAQLLMWQITKDDYYLSHVDSFIDQILTLQTTPKGLIYRTDWASNRHAANMAHFLFQVAETGHRETEIVSKAEFQIGYILGDSGRSYVVGHGSNWPQKPHHRGASCPDMPEACYDGNALKNPGPNYQLLEGALVGGPDSSDNFSDNREAYEYTEVACDYNAGFQSAVAYMALKYGR